jgi:tetratricopeptide (TPR) repeat protein
MIKRSARKSRLPESSVLWWLFLFFPMIAQQATAQSNYWPDSLKRELAHATDWQEKARFAGNLALYYFGQDRPLSDSFGRQAVEAAEMSRDRLLMIRTYIVNGRRFLQGVGLKDNLQQAMENLRQAEQIAREDKLDEGLVETDCAFADVYRTMGDNERALTYSNQAVTTAVDMENDSVQVMAYASLGESYEARNEKLLAFRNYLKALDVAEQARDEVLIRNASAYLSYFYFNIRAYDKAIDYELNVISIDRRLRRYFELRGDYNTLAQFFTKKKEYDIALGLYEHAIELADSIHFDLVKIDSYFGIFDTYFKSGHFQKGIAYLGVHPVVTDYLDRAGMHYFIDGIYGSAYKEMRRFDSAAFYFNREEPEVERNANEPSRADYYDEVGEFYKLQDAPVKAIAYYLKEQGVGKVTGDLQVLQKCALNLDSLYWRTGDYRTAYTYHTLYALYSDSLRNLAKETDLLKLEVDNDNRRREREAREDELSREHRHNVQYMGFTVGLVVLFIALVMLGWLAVPPSVIRALGFLSFIFLFEFIILLADKQIQGWTHEEPWKVLLIKIGLAAILVPLHHWLERKVILYLSSRKRFSGKQPGKGAEKAGPAESVAG